MNISRPALFRKIGLSGVAANENPLAIQINRFFNAIVAFCILLLPIMWWVDQLPEFNLVTDWIHLLSWLIWLLLVIEVIVMMITLDRPLFYLKQNWLNIPIVVLTFPLLLSSIPYAIVLRILQLMIFARYIATLHRGLQKLFRVSQLGAIVLAFIFIVIISGIVIQSIDPSVSNLEEGLWWSLATMATVGYGDIVPTSTEGRLFGALIIVMGTVFFSLLTAQLAAYMVGEDEIARDRELLQTLKDNQKTLLTIQERDDERLEQLLLTLISRIDHLEQRVLFENQANQNEAPLRSQPHESSQ